MKKQYKILLATLAALLLVMVGVTFAYYTAKTSTNSETSEIKVETAVVGDAILNVEGNLDNATNQAETDILPGHKSVVKLKVTADRGEMPDDFDVNFMLIWKGINELKTPLNFTVYKTSNADAKINVSCSVDTKTYTTDNSVEVRYSEKCSLSSDTINITDDVIDSGTIKPTDAEKMIKLADNQTITASKNPVPVYYLVVIEYPDDGDQSEDMSSDEITKGLSGVVTVRPVGEAGSSFKDYIIAKTPFQTDEPDFSKTSCTAGIYGVYDDCEEETVGLYECIIKEDGECAKKDDLSTLDTTNLERTYYYRGDLIHNYVEFAGFYWRIIRINENGSLRLIYQGRTKDENGNKLEIQKTGSETQIGESAFNTNGDQAEFVGFKYELGYARGTKYKSTILEESLEPWYQTNIIAKGLESHIDKESGFCGDRSITSGTGIGTEDTNYGAYTRLNKQPTFECPNSEDLYKTGIGLITADEVVYAGGNFSYNAGYYLNNGSYYWTITPSFFEANGLRPNIYFVTPDTSGIHSEDANVHAIGVRPVINVSDEFLIITGNGTIDSPYVLQ